MKQGTRDQKIVYKSKGLKKKNNYPVVGQSEPWIHVCIFYQSSGVSSHSSSSTSSTRSNCLATGLRLGDRRLISGL